MFAFLPLTKENHLKRSLIRGDRRCTGQHRDGCAERLTSLHSYPTNPFCPRTTEHLCWYIWVGLTEPCIFWGGSCGIREREAVLLWGLLGLPPPLSGYMGVSLLFHSPTATGFVPVIKKLAEDNLIRPTLTGTTSIIYYKKNLVK